MVWSFPRDFFQFGRLRGYAFIEFEDERDAEE